MTTPWVLLLQALTGICGGLLALKTGIPAAPLAGALLAAGAGEPQWTGGKHVHLARQAHAPCWKSPSAP
jgi:uncharacterized membrane protein AbrB (regulator of aidB expression)